MHQFIDSDRVESKKKKKLQMSQKEQSVFFISES